MSGGGKGGTSSTSVEIPAWLESAARQNIARADQIAQIGYVPYYGPDVAAMTPMQLAAGGNINTAASAFGLGAPSSPMAGMQPAMDYGGMAAYSSAPLYEQSLAQLQARRPGQFAALQAPFLNPFTGAGPAAPFSANLAFADQTMAPLMQPVVNNGGNDNMAVAPAPVDTGYSGSFASSPLRAALPGGVNDPFLESGFSQAVARTFDTPQSPPTAADRPIMRPDPNNDNDYSNVGFGSDLSRSLTDPNYDPPGNVISRALGTVSPNAREGDSLGGGK
jgi:hypothetical protein